MFQYRQVLVRLRAGDSERELARGGLMGRDKLASFRALASRQGWLDASAELPDDAAIAAAIGESRRARSTISTVEPHRAVVQHWLNAGVGGKAIHAALCREHGYTGSYSSVARMLVALRGEQPPEVTVRLTFEPGDAAQVDFGAGPMLVHPDGQPRRTWAFVMTLAHSRHQYVEFVWDQTVATWLGCHRRAFEWFAAVPARVIIDNAKCAITKACARDPLVQRAYAECAEGYGFKIDACPPHDPQKKGIVEAGVKYVKGNFLPTRAFRDLADLNVQAKAWVMNEAGVRIHGTTRRGTAEAVRVGAALDAGAARSRAGSRYLAPRERAPRLPCAVRAGAVLGAVRAGGQDAVAARHRRGRRAVRGLPPRRHAPARPAPRRAHHRA